MSESKLYTRSEVQKVNGKDSTLIIIHDEVYDVTSFLNEHPGGEEVLLEHGGKDATEDFRDVGHSTDALELMKKYRVGALVESERSNIPPKKGWVAGYNSERPEKYVNGPGVPFYLLVGALSVVIFAFYYLL